MQKKTVGKLRAGTAVLLALLLAFVLAACNPKQQQPPVVQTGSLQITVQGLTGVDAEITVTGPGSFSQPVTATTTLEDLVVGEYTVSAAAVAGYVVSGRNTWTVDVEKDSTAQVNFTYVAGDVAAFGTLDIKIVGLTGSGLDAAVTVTGPAPFVATEVKDDITLTNLAPGSYTVTAADVSGFVVSGLTEKVAEVTAGTTASVTVTYIDASSGLGTLEFDVQGLATGASAKLQVTGPGLDGQLVLGAAPAPLLNLQPGTYTVAAQPVEGHFLVPESTVSVEITAGNTSKAVVKYVHAGLTLSGATEAVVPLQGNRSLTFTVNRVGEMDGPVAYTVTVPEGITVAPDSGAIPAGVSAFTVVMGDGGGDVDVYEASVTVSGTVLTHGLSDEVELTIDLAPVVTVESDNYATPVAGSLRSLVYDPRTTGKEITFAEELYAPTGVTIALDETLDIVKSVSISGPEDWDDTTGPLVRLDADFVNRVIIIRHVDPVTPAPTVVLSNLQVQNGAEQDGAGIMVDGGSDLTLNGVWVHSNAASQSGGGVWIRDNSVVSVQNSRVEDNTAAVRGAGLYLESGNLDLFNTVVTGNIGQNGGGVMAASGSGLLNIIDSTISENAAVNGAGVYSHADAVIQGSSILKNIASGDGGGIRNQLRMEIVDTIIEDNEAAGDYGGILSDGIMTIRDSWVRNNSAIGRGGGIFNGWYNSDTLGVEAKEMTIERTEISGNTAGDTGGGIHSIRRLAVIDSYVFDNRAVDGGGIYSVSIPATGAPRNDGGYLVISGTTIAENIADMYGGAVYSDTKPCFDSGCLDAFTNVPDADLHVYNSTVTGNTAGWGGGLYLAGANSGEVRLSFNTITSNSANGSDVLTGAGGGISNSRENVRIRGNIIVYNAVSGGGIDTNDVYTSLNDIESDGYNIIHRAPSDVNLTLTDTSPVLDTSILDLEQVRADHGGFAPTLRLGSASIAANAVPIAECVSASGTTLSRDQRGALRPGVGGTACSIGAYEYQGE